MTLLTFTPPVSPSSLSDKPEVKLWQADFGDGYSQPTPAGINYRRRVVALRWDVLTLAQAREVLDFLERHGGNVPFFYRIPREPNVTKFTSSNWTETRLSAGLIAIDATFRQTFTNKT